VHALASRSVAVGILSSTTAQNWDDVTALRIDDDRARSQFGVVWRPHPSHATQALLRRLLPTRHSISQ
jgi:hypothetical protein